MGSLDDAIREHLELKRQHGASDEELQRQADEAFGRGRKPEPVPEAAEQDLGEDPLSPEPLAMPDDIEAAEPESNGQPPHSESTFEPDPFEPQPIEPDEVPSEESLEGDVKVRDARSDDGEPDPDSASDQDRPPATSDPLEETPEFLEESPEEDRLWFEQRPPKDFDFD